MGGGGVYGWTDEQAETNLQPTNLRSFFTKNPNLKKRRIFFSGGGGGGGGGWVVRVGVGKGYMDGPNQFAPSTSSKLGA